MILKSLFIFFIKNETVNNHWPLPQPSQIQPSEPEKLFLASSRTHSLYIYLHHNKYIYIYNFIKVVSKLFKININIIILFIMGLESFKNILILHLKYIFFIWNRYIKEIKFIKNKLKL